MSLNGCKRCEASLAEVTRAREERDAAVTERDNARFQERMMRERAMNAEHHSETLHEQLRRMRGSRPKDHPTDPELHPHDHTPIKTDTIEKKP